MLTVGNPSHSPAHSVYIEKKSEFIADACHINSLDEAVSFVEKIRSQHPKARHVCFAAVVGAEEAQFQERMSDDGEPSGTAGKPILQVLRQSGTTNTVIAVTRYFGGILLGAGGLVRAYSTAAADALKAAQLREIVPAQYFSCTVDYAQYTTVQHVIAQSQGKITSEEFTDKIALEFMVPVQWADTVEENIQQTFHASIQPVRTRVGSIIQ
ncbi:YigZ family protein [Alloscardovia criceti]|uniref:YigZ family protein n=1 Tax=Alloscardovia criceti TaxID=356828 RepID=UPI000370297B|nr:YigZ family protein [Alloscardovia criceti]